MKAGARFIRREAVHLGQGLQPFEKHNLEDNIGEYIVLPATGVTAYIIVAQLLSGPRPHSETVGIKPPQAKIQKTEN